MKIIKLKVSEKYICLTDNFHNFTLGKIYQGVIISPNSYIELTNDKGGPSYPSKFGYDGPDNYVVYFMELNEWRQKQLDIVLKVNP